MYIIHKNAINASIDKGKYVVCFQKMAPLDGYTRDEKKQCVLQIAPKHNFYELKHVLVNDWDDKSLSQKIQK